MSASPVLEVGQVLGEPRGLVGVLPLGPVGLLAGVVGAVRADGVAGASVLLGHRLWARRRIVGRKRDRVRVDQFDDFPGGVVAVFPEAVDELRVERPGVLAQALPVRTRFRRPPRDGVGDVGRPVEEVGLVSVLTGRGTEHLCGLEQQLVHVLVAVVARREPRVPVEPEDVHGGRTKRGGLSVSSAIFNGRPVEPSRMITGRRMAAVDENAAALGVPRKQLMESSGAAVARTVREVAEPGSRVVVVAGRGNNGGDAFVAARFLDGYDVTTLLLGRAEAIGTEIARENWDALQRADYDTREVTDSSAVDLPEADVIVDAMLGTGISGDLREPAATAAAAIDDADATVVAVDVPSGLDADGGEGAANGVDADHVVTFHDVKPGLEDLAAEVTVADIGIPAAAERFVGPGDVRLARPDGRDGRPYVVGGGPYTGAPALAAQAALRAGAELSFVAAPDAVAGEIQGYSEDLIVQPYAGEVLTPDQADDLLETAQQYDNVVVLGPGLGIDDDTLEAAREFLSAYAGEVVVDADALRVVPDLETDATLICTPNRRELARMGGPDTDDLAAVVDEIESFAADLGHVILAKGATDVITDGERTRLSRSGTVGMKVGGTGDTLAGIVAALLEDADPLEAAAAAARVNGLAGERLAERDEHGFLASDLLGELPGVLWGGHDE